TPKNACAASTSHHVVHTAAATVPASQPSASPAMPERPRTAATSGASATNASGQAPGGNASPCTTPPAIASAMARALRPETPFPSVCATPSLRSLPMSRFPRRADAAIFLLLAAGCVLCVLVAVGGSLARLGRIFPGFVVWDNLVVVAIGPRTWTGIAADV